MQNVESSNGTDVTDTGASLDPSLVILTPSGAVKTDRTTGEKSQDFTYTYDKAAVDAGDIVLAGPETNYKVTAKVADFAASFKYAGAELKDSYELDYASGNVFAVSGVTAVSGKATFKLGSGVTVSYDKEKLAAGQSSSGVQNDFEAGKPGTYTLTFTAFGQDKDGKWVAGSKTVTVKYLEGSVDADKSLFVYGPDSATKAITEYAKAYDGKALTADDFTVGGSDEYGNAYTNLKKTLLDKDGKEVKEAKDAGTYTLKVTSDKYALSGTTELPITIAKVDLTQAEVGKLELWNDVSGEQFLPLNDKTLDADGEWDGKSYTPRTYTVNSSGSAIDALALVYQTGNEADGSKGADDPKDAKFEAKDLKGLDELPDNVGVTVEHLENGSWKPLGSFTSGEDYEGQYRVTLTVNKAEAGNYVLPEGKTQVTLEFNAYDRARFSDVQPSDWFFAPVNKAAKNKYMNGYGGTTAFGPNDVLTRGQMVSVLFNMSGAKVDESDMSYDKVTGWKTGFSDVDGNQFYGQSVYWAKATGVVNGYGDGTFHPDQPVTREELAAMLSNYAKVVNRDTTVDTADQSVLSKFSDGSGVSEWARGAVAWAASSKVLGNGGYLGATSHVTRAEAASMAVNYQPNAKTLQ